MSPADFQNYRNGAFGLIAKQLSDPEYVLPAHRTDDLTLMIRTAALAVRGIIYKMAAIEEEREAARAN